MKQRIKPLRYLMLAMLLLAATGCERTGNGAVTLPSATAAPAGGQRRLQPPPRRPMPI